MNGEKKISEKVLSGQSSEKQNGLVDFSFDALADNKFTMLFNFDISSFDSAVF